MDIISSHPTDIPTSCLTTRSSGSHRFRAVEIDYRQYPVLAVDDEPDILQLLKMACQGELVIETATSGEAALADLRERDFAVILADQRMPGMSGTELLEQSMEIRPDAVRIILTGYTDNQALMDAINYSRIYRYLTKPWNVNELRSTLKRAIETFHLHRERLRLSDELRVANERLRGENAYLRQAAAVDHHEIIGNSPAIRQVLSLVERVGPSNATVLIEGESGTGKELVARAIHAASQRRDELAYAVNCAGFTEGTLESQLFGHRKGAFTGATENHKGFFESADGSTLFLDEVGEIPFLLQAKLLRALQEGEVLPLGETRPRKVDVRIIAATNRRLDEEVKAGRFREDLYYRLGVIKLKMPPLRERREDIPTLAHHLLARIAARDNAFVGEPTPEALAVLSNYSFPGNVRELANAIERAIILAGPGAAITDDLFPEEFRAAAPVLESGEANGSLRALVREFERNHIQSAMQRAAGNRTKAAKELGLGYRGLLEKMRGLGMLESGDGEA